ncbi:NADH:ubiquinone reductase (Na(+)-transporting) subunit B [Geoalkalibacter halelectricus]|uniref:Na(+)-translocating NADH-quinone reductase subunit B n=1 Tax=Geoalkalibacter halelectricus TaxID=2847045 RepID=A0ABY5ZLK9_9BACT|nr:NADH:ubiquinone reductase (Na(+)-transporting) subunit B [Geoalkalibacter halelectricus]MDO3378698.1 NADH:ubiquinone reductase (Na(+)-transporting) subunit B [Geoalkalibacter halelectricus]UWZ79993.1 NADH:ubiquinone reductase (Na(+)-transporting) subunit B [Geoalkalibacter halelectricus]
MAADRLAPIKRALGGYWRPPGGGTRSAPHVRDALSLKRIMLVVVLALLPCALFAMWNTGYQMHLAMQAQGITELFTWREEVFRLLGVGNDPAYLGDNLLLGALYFLPVLLVCWAAAFFWEALFAAVRGMEMSEGWGVSGLLLALILPPAVPLWQAALAMSFGIVLGKEIFGGTGRNFMNPALTAYAFIFFAYPANFSADNAFVPVDGISAATPLALAAEGGLGEVQAHFTWGQAFLGLIPGSPGETSALLCLVGAAILLFTGVASWRTMSAVLLGALGLATLLYLVGSTENPLFSVPPHWHLVLGSLAFGLVFMATDPVSSAMTDAGKWFYGLLVGAMIILVRVVNPAFAEGTMLAIVFGNVLAPVIDRFVLKTQMRRRRLRYGQG